MSGAPLTWWGTLPQAPKMLPDDFYLIYQNSEKNIPGVNPIKLFFFIKQRFFLFFSVKLGNFKAQTIFSYATNTQA
jgi:hypothetical protein